MHLLSITLKCPPSAFRIVRGQIDSEKRFVRFEQQENNDSHNNNIVLFSLLVCYVVLSSSLDLYL